MSGRYPRLRRDWRLLALCAGFLTVLLVAVGTVRVRPYVFGWGWPDPRGAVQNVSGRVDLFDQGIGHQIQLRLQPNRYQRMLDGYAKDGSKGFVAADLTIDGTLLPSVGIRLKGNSSLATLTRNGRLLHPEPNSLADPGAQLPEEALGARGTGLGLRAEDPQRLPWLIRFDEYVPGRRYQGRRELAVRVGGPLGGGRNLLNEALSLRMIASAGDVAPRYTYVSLTVEGHPSVSRLVIENPDESYTGRLPGRGVLYKARATGHMADRGDDPVRYRDDFEQVTMRRSQDIQPVIGLVRWVAGCSDAEFDSGLADRVDVPGLARYLATQRLLANFDDMGGPGNNFYLWYELGSSRFQVLGWDYNLAMTGEPEQDPEQPGQAGPDTGAGQSSTGNPLKRRFLASPKFRAVYLSAYRDLYTDLYANDRALHELDDIVGVVRAVKGVDLASVDQEQDKLRDFVARRADHLASGITNGR